jgi:hypothetical protein
MHGHPTITTAEETSRHATGSHPCLRNKSRRSSTLSKWRWKSTSRRNLTHISSNDYASTSWTWRLGEYLPNLSTWELERTAFTS